MFPSRNPRRYDLGESNFDGGVVARVLTEVAVRRERRAWMTLRQIRWTALWLSEEDVLAILARLELDGHVESDSPRDSQGVARRVWRMTATGLWKRVERAEAWIPQAAGPEHRTRRHAHRLRQTWGRLRAEELQDEISRLYGEVRLRESELEEIHHARGAYRMCTTDARVLLALAADRPDAKRWMTDVEIRRTRLAIKAVRRSIERLLVDGLVRTKREQPGLSRAYEITAKGRRVSDARA